MAYFSFSGRAKRMQWWMVNVVAAVVLTIVQVAAGGMMVAGGEDGGGSAVIVAVIGGILGLVLLVASIATSVRRLHDQDKSGWWYLLSLVPLANIYVLVLCGFIGGTAGDNRFGAPPA